LASHDLERIPEVYKKLSSPRPMWMVSCTPWPLYLGEKASGTRWTGSWLGPI